MNVTVNYLNKTEIDKLFADADDSINTAWYIN